MKNRKSLQDNGCLPSPALVISPAFFLTAAIFCLLQNLQPASPHSVFPLKVRLALISILSGWYGIQFHKFIVLVIFFFFVPYLWTWMNKGNIPFKRRKGTKMTHIYLLPASPVRSVLVKMCNPPNPPKSLVSQTALEGSHCDCENDWDLINYPPWLM